MEEFFKRLYIRSEQVVSTLVLIYFGKPPLRITIKRNYITFQTVDSDMCLILIYYIKGSGTRFLTVFCV